MKTQLGLEHLRWTVSKNMIYKHLYTKPWTGRKLSDLSMFFKQFLHRATIWTFHKTFHGFKQVNFAYGSFVLGLSQFSLLH
jgi:hypothetical protein